VSSGQPEVVDWEFDPGIDLGARNPGLKGRQTLTARTILERLRDQPGVLLADEVGLGKTFVALASAASVLRSDGFRRPVLVVSRSPEVITKWMNDWDDFRSWCLTNPESRRIRTARIEGPAGLLQVAGTPVSSRPNLLFSTSGRLKLESWAGDRWISLAIAHRAMRGRRGAKWKLRRDLLAQRSVTLFGCSWNEADMLLQARLRDWHTVARDADVPQPELLGKVAAALDEHDVDLAEVQLALAEHLPLHRRRLTKQQVAKAKEALDRAFAHVWPRIVGLLQGCVDVSLLIVDEAHNVKNDHTVASRLITENPLLCGAADRMLFLTATPFSLRHSELIDVLRHFGHVKPSLADPGLSGTLDELQRALDTYQSVFGEFSRAWERLNPTDLPTGDGWWSDPSSVPGVGRTLPAVLDEVRIVADHLRPWVIRHVQVRHRVEVRGRDVLASAGAPDPSPSVEDVGIDIPEAAALPFLLAAQADAVLRLPGPGTGKRGSGLFAERLDSSFDAFVRFSVPEGESAPAIVPADDHGRVTRYWGEIKNLIGADSGSLRDVHPKVCATADLCAESWWSGEKVLVFATFIPTRKALERAITERIAARIGEELVRHGHARDSLAQGAVSLARSGSQVEQAIRAAAVRLALEAGLPADHHPQLEKVLLRFFRSPSWSARFIDLEQRTLRDAYVAAVSEGTPHYERLGAALGRFMKRLAQDARMSGGPTANGGAQQHLQDLRRIATGWRDVSDPVAGGKAKISPAVAQVSTGTKEKDRVIAGFNSPFFPDIVLTGRILQEGVDLHRECRTVVHHDLDWNPGTVEQRTGRVDRVGSKAEETGLPILVFLPYIAGTQDERRHRVVTDRARWFREVLDGDRRTGEAGEAESERPDLPGELAELMRIDLSLPDDR
jgi:hypothetical protein